ncbi:SIS domain-containing protein [Nonomuraea glycinis]|uniref:Phosphoheptose isomerase n=1 Tax=Nonomuraea glycinis TaxID=2047744 RepID=A0A918A9J0_9ACTN|nr:SIS domain-containing protein [Nonomuraea glycinis]MCA2177547.1 SIS domain-containing protein [Nonomuraea glycinis]GGP09526.1 phosphoheptose isomerase [Nonomuraea glycinis]
MTGHLYPFLRPGATTDEELTRSTVAKATESLHLRLRVLNDLGPALTACADALATAFRNGGTLFAFGNGGSSTDAQSVAHLFSTGDPGGASNPGNPGGTSNTADKGGTGDSGGAQPALPALSLTGDAALLTALANDVDFDVVFARQLAALGRPGDIAVALSTSGGSANVLRGLEQARRTGMVTVGFAGSGGGRMAEENLADHLFVIPSSSVHRIQEAQTTAYHVLWQLTQQALDQR